MPKLNPHRDYLTEADLEKLIAKLTDNQDRLLVRLLFYTGARISEMLSLRVEDIDLDKRTLVLPALKRKDTSWKIVVFPERLLPELKQYCKGRRGRLFTISRQIAYNRIHLAGTLARLGNVYPHLLRDSCATNWALRGGELVRLQRQLGHRSLSTTTDRYLKYSTSDIRQEADKVWG